MRLLFSISLIFALLLPTARKCLVFAGYLANKEYIAKNLCENRSKPKSCCQGKCYLGKKMSEEEKKENKGPVNIKEKSELQFCQHSPMVLSAASSMIQKNSFIYKNNYSFCLPGAVFHPPSALR